jgi:hypothetical protein
MRSRLAVVFAVFISGWLWLDARAQSGGPLVSGAHRFEKIANGYLLRHRVRDDAGLVPTRR